jgi:hypothetical protein
LGLLVAAVVLLFLLLVVLPPLRRVFLMRHLQRPLWPVAPTARVMNQWRRALAVLGVLEIEPAPGETPRDFAGRVEVELGATLGCPLSGLKTAASRRSTTPGVASVRVTSRRRARRSTLSSRPSVPGSRSRRRSPRLGGAHPRSRRETRRQGGGARPSTCLGFDRSPRQLRRDCELRLAYGLVSSRSPRANASGRWSGPR